MNSIVNIVFQWLPNSWLWIFGVFPTCQAEGDRRLPCACVAEKNDLCALLGDWLKPLWIALGPEIGIPSELDVPVTGHSGFRCIFLTRATTHFLFCLFCFIVFSVWLICLCFRSFVCVCVWKRVCVPPSSSSSSCVLLCLLCLLFLLYEKKAESFSVLKRRIGWNWKCGNW